MALTIPNTFVNGTPAVATQVNANFTAVKTEVDLKVDSTLVDAKGDLIVATAADTVARQAVGSNGQVLVADSGVTNGVAWVDPQTNRNVIINGAMQVAQRGTSTASITGSNYYTADRWLYEPSSMGTWTESVENDAPTGSGFRKSLKLLCTTADASPAAGDYILFDQRLEGQNLQQFLKGTASAKSFALSFWVKSNATGTYNVEVLDNDNTRVVSAAYTVDVSGTWEKKTVIFPADTTGAFDNDNANSLQLSWWLGAGSNFTSGTRGTVWATPVSANRAVGQTNVAAATSNYWQITGVQLEVGSVATPFEFEDIGVTLAKCQRYFQKIGPISNVASGMAYSTTQGFCIIFLAVPMRIAPTSITVSATASHYEMVRSNTAQTACSAVPTINNSNPNAVSILTTIGAADLVAGNATFLVGVNSTSGWIGANAEL